MGKGATTRRYTEEFKRDAVALLRSSGRPIAEVAKQFGVTDTSLGNWAREQAKTAGESDVEAEKEMVRLRKRMSAAGWREAEPAFRSPSESRADWVTEEWRLELSATRMPDERNPTSSEAVAQYSWSWGPAEGRGELVAEGVAEAGWPKGWPRRGGPRWGGPRRGGSETTSVHRPHRAPTGVP